MVMEPPSPQCVGREFVRQYYTLLNQAPLHLHRFYNDQSSFVHGGIDSATEAEVVSGQQEIHQKIVQLNFKDCHAKIRKVDSHKTLAEGVVVQVSGELSNNGEPMRRFVQTFVLAPQTPKKYYVHNDIFRYQDEVLTESEVETGVSSSNVVDEGRLEEPIHKQIIAAAVKQPASLPEPVKAEPIPAAPAVIETFNPEPVVHMNGGGGYVSPGVNIEAAVNMDVEEETWKTQPEPQPWKTNAAPVVPAAAAPEIEDEEVMGDDDEEEGEEPALTPVQDAPNSNEPMSWSSRVKLGAGKPPAAPAPAQPQPAAQPGTASKEGTPFSGQNNGRNAEKPYRGARGNSQGRSAAPAPGGAPPQRQEGERRFKDEDAPPRQRMMSLNSDHLQLFVGNLPHNVTEAELVDLFGKFGKVADVRINKKTKPKGQAEVHRQVPNFGFVVFEEPSAVEQAISSQPILLYGTHRLNIETKKTKTGGGPGMFQDRVQGGRPDRERGSQDNLRGAGHPGGGGGGGRGGGPGGDRMDRGGRGMSRGGGGGGRGRGGDFSSRGRGGPPNDTRGGFRGGGGGGPRQN